MAASNTRFTQNSLYRVPEIVTRGRFPDGGESDSTWRNPGGSSCRLRHHCQDFDASQLRGLARKTKDGPQVAIPRQMFQEILRLIAELRPKPPPAHHAMHRRDRATLDHAGDGLPLSVVELGRLSCRLAIQETVRTAGCLLYTSPSPRD